MVGRKKKPTKAEQEAEIADLRAQLAHLEGREPVAVKPVAKKAEKEVKAAEDKKTCAAPAIEYISFFLSFLSMFEVWSTCCADGPSPSSII